MLNKWSFKWKVLLTLSTMFIFSAIFIPRLVYAVGEADTWVIPKGSINDNQENIIIDDDNIIQKGTHVAGTSKVFYRTTGYYMTFNKCSISNAFDIDNKAYIPVKVKSDRIGGTVTSTYTISKSDFINAMLKLGVTSAQIKDKGYTTVYLHNVFELYNPQTGDAYSKYTNILGYQEMMDAAWSITGGHTWAGDTPEILKSYYNFPYEVYPTLFDVEVVAATEVSGKLVPLKILKSKTSGIFQEKYPLNANYTAPDKLTVDGINYNSKGYWFVRFNRRTNNEAVQGPHNSGLSISNYSLPDAQKDSTVTIYVAYEPPASTDIVVNAADIDDKGKIIKSNMDTDKKAPNEDYSQPADTLNPQITFNKENYTRTKYYSYKYVKSDGAVKEISGSVKSEDTLVKLQVPSDIKADSTLTVSIYYKKAPPDKIPVTVKAIDKATGNEIPSSLGSGLADSNKLYQHNKVIPDSLTASSKAYSFSGNWDWSYTKSTSAKPVVTNKGSGTGISFMAPAFNEVSGGITVKVYYNSSSPDTADGLTLRVIMVNSSGQVITEISKETVSRDQPVAKTADLQKSVNGVIYTFLDKWDYQYITSSGSTTKSGTGKTAAFTIPSAASTGSVVTLKFYYKGEIPIEPDEPEQPIKEALDLPTPYGVINGDKYLSPYFFSKQGISTTESQYVYVKTKDYLLGYTLVNRTGVKKYSIPVTMHYTLEYYSATPAEYGGPKKITDEATDTQVIEIERKYNYWEITNLEYYTVSAAEVHNYSLPGGSVSLPANNSYLTIPSLSTWHGSGPEEHVKAPKQEKEGIEVRYEKTISSKTSVRPDIEYQDLTSYANELTDEAEVRSDYLMFDGSVVLSNEYSEEKGANPMPSSLRQCAFISQDKALYTEGKVIDAVKENGTYSSGGSVTYKLHPESVNSSYSTRAYNVPVNDVIIHTPVICDPVITADNDKWTQLVSPEKGAIQLILDPDTGLNDFKVKISNTLLHSNLPGYYTRDFSRSFIDPDNISYIAKMNDIVRNEMKLPFDVYIDTLSDNNQTNDKFIKAGTWIVLGRATARFYVPMWVQEGIYTAEFRTIAVNGTDKLYKTEVTRNTALSNYVATSAKTFQVSGRIYGLTLYDISDYPDWEEAFRVKDTMLFKLFENAVDGTMQPAYDPDYAYYYTVGSNNQYGTGIGRYNKYTLPLVNGSHPRYKNLGVLKTGYAVRFMLDTTGEMYGSGDHITITPTFYYVDAKGKNRQQIDLYYKEEINGKLQPIVKVGEGIDLVNIQSGTTGNIYSRIPEAEIKNTVAVMNTTYTKISTQYSAMYSYSQLKLLKAFRTFTGTGYASKISGLSSYADVKKATGLTKTGLSKYMQRWYGTYKLPLNVHAAPAGYDVFGYLKKYGIDYKEDFWLTGGYIIVNFNIVTIDKNGKEHLSYINAENYLNHGGCSMWVTEGPSIQKTDNTGAVFNFKAGDFIIYYTDKKMSDDYEGSLY